jgi:hypothetical protein
MNASAQIFRELLGQVMSYEWMDVAWPNIKMLLPSWADRPQAFLIHARDVNFYIY